MSRIKQAPPPPPRKPCMADGGLPFSSVLDSPIYERREGNKFVYPRGLTITDV